MSSHAVRRSVLVRRPQSGRQPCVGLRKPEKEGDEEDNVGLLKNEATKSVRCNDSAINCLG